MTISREDKEFIALRLNQCRHLLENKSIFLTGGTGFFGKWLLEAVSYFNSDLGMNISVTVLSRDPEKFGLTYPHLSKIPGVEFVKGNIIDFSAPYKSYDYIIHAATDASAFLNETDPELMRRTIMEGAKSITKFANDTNSKRLLYTSSGAVYGFLTPKNQAISESEVNDTILDSDNAYASSKLASERYFEKELACDLVIARCFAFSGPYLPLDGSYAFGNFIRDRLYEQDISVRGNGKSIRSYLYAADLVIWLLTILIKGKDREVYNVGSNEPISINNLANIISGNKLNVITELKDDNPVSYYYPSIEKARSELGLSVYTSLSDAILKTINFELKNEPSC